MNNIEHFVLVNAVSSLDVVVSSYKTLGPLKIMIILFIEAFFPFIPLCGLVILNAITFGFVKGLAISYFASLAGNWTLYATFRYFGNLPMLIKFRRKDSVQKYASWIENKGFLLIAICCFVPVIINSVISILAGINRISFRMYALASATGILCLFLLLTIIGVRLTSVGSGYGDLVLIVAMIIALIAIGRIVQKKLNESDTIEK